MSLCILGGVAVGCWAVLSLISGERQRQRQEIDLELAARKKALLAAEKAALEAEQTVS